MLVAERPKQSQRLLEALAGRLEVTRVDGHDAEVAQGAGWLLYTSPSPRDS